MLKPMMEAMYDSMGAGDPGVVRLIKGNSDLMHSMAKPQIVLAMKEISEDPKKLGDYRDNPEVMDALDSVSRLAVFAIEDTDERTTMRSRVPGHSDQDLDDDELQQQQQAEKHHRRKAHAPRAASKVQRVMYDVEGWEQRPWYEYSTAMAKCLQQKGFCVLRGGVASTTRENAINEAAKLKKLSQFTRPPKEVLTGFFGEVGSAWTFELSDPNYPAVKREANLRAIDEHLEEIGFRLSGCSTMWFGKKIKGRTVGVVHSSRMPDDPPNPPLALEADLADYYMALFTRKRLKMVYYAGPGQANMRVTTIDDDEPQTYRASLPADTIIALRCDVVRLAVEPRSSLMGITVEIDFLAETFVGPRETLRDRVPAPEALERWYMDQLQDIVDHEREDNVPVDWKTLARSLLYRSTTNPACIRELSYDLPRGVPQENLVSVMEGSAFWGDDGVREIPFSKWDITAYYDEDPVNVDDFKMYTRHMGVLDRGHPASDDYDLTDFGIPQSEAATVDPRHVMLCESATECLRQAGMTKSFTQGKNIGLFVGLTGNELVYRFISREAKLGKSSCCNMSNASNVNRMSYLFGSTGPSVAVDTEDSSGSSAVDTSISYLREGRCEMTIASSVSLLQHPFSLIFHCASGGISRTGRCLVFDEGADGVVRSDGVITLLLQLKRKLKRGEHGEVATEEASDEVMRSRCMILGTALNSRGVSSSLMAPNAAAIQDVLMRAFKDASCPVSVIQALDLNASGSALPDAMELGMMQKVVSCDQASCVVARNCKSIFGETGAVSGLASLVRAVFSLESSRHGPCIHFKQFSEMAENVCEDEGAGSASRILHIIEMVEARMASQTIGVNSFGGSGTSVHHVVWGQKPDEERLRLVNRPISWFPPTAREPAPDDEPEAEYFIIGSWNAWEKPIKMKKDKDLAGVFTHTLVLGENRWETFQIWSRDKGKLSFGKEFVLHPLGSRISAQEAEIFGPTARSMCGRFMTWLIDGRPQRAYLINEDQAQELKEKAERGEEDGPSDCIFKVTFCKGYKPPGYGNATRPDQMPKVETNRALFGLPGDQYRVRLHLSGGGKYRRIEWTKVPDDGLVKLPEYTHRYYIAGDHNYWFFAPMQSRGRGKYTGKVKLLGESTTFQVVRDKDWDQTFGPKTDLAGQDAEIETIMQGGLLAKKWKISGQAGDCFEVAFQRTPTDDRETDTRHISWNFIENEAVDPVEMAKDHKYFVVGSWDNFVEPLEMDFDEGRGAFACEMPGVISSTGEESFQILLNANWLSVVYPKSKEASFLDDRGHEVKGPDTSGSNNCWVVGRHKDDEAKKGNPVRILLFCEAGLPRRVSWERFDREAKRQFVAQETLSILDQHCEKLAVSESEQPGEQPE